MRFEWQEGRGLLKKLPYVLVVLMLILTVGMFEFFYPRNLVPRVSAVEATVGIGVYWNANCASRVLSIDWGVLSLGQTKSILVYVRNEGNDSILLTVTPANYSPADASNYLYYSWTCGDTRIGAGKTIGVTQSLYISFGARVSSFSFDLVFSGKEYILGDVNKDGVVDLLDAVKFALAYGSTPQNSRWNPEADLNNDNVVNIYDGVIFARIYSALQA